MATPSVGRGTPHPPPSPRPMLHRSPLSSRSIPRFRPPLHPLPPTPLGALRPLELPHALLPPAPDTDIARRDEDFGDRTGGLVACRSMADGSAPHGKCPRSPRVVVRYGISRPLFQHLPQQWHPMHCLSALRNSHACADGPVVEQVKYRVQLQHHSTISWACWLGQITVELVPKPR